jgi:hypothetical protein
MIVVPFAIAVTRPDADTEATPGFDDVHVALFVTSCDDVADCLSTAASCAVCPTTKVSPPVKEIEGWNVVEGAGDVVVGVVVDVVLGVVAEFDEHEALRAAATTAQIDRREEGIGRRAAQTLPLSRARHQQLAAIAFRNLYAPSSRADTSCTPPWSQGLTDKGGCYDLLMKGADCILFSGGAPGAEAAFGVCAEKRGVEEVNFTFDGHRIDRHRGVRVLNHEELLGGDVSLAYVSRLMHRRYTDSPTIRRVLQTLWYQVNNGQEIYVVGTILDDATVRGGTGWGAEFAKLCNKPLCVFDQDRNAWLRWSGDGWERLGQPDAPIITHPHFTGTGTRDLRDNGRAAIEDLFKRSFD